VAAARARILVVGAADVAEHRVLEPRLERVVGFEVDAAGGGKLVRDIEDALDQQELGDGVGPDVAAGARDDRLDGSDDARPTGRSVTSNVVRKKMSPLAVGATTCVPAGIRMSRTAGLPGREKVTKPVAATALLAAEVEQRQELVQVGAELAVDVEPAEFRTLRSSWLSAICTATVSMILRSGVPGSAEMDGSSTRSCWIICWAISLAVRAIRSLPSRQWASAHRGPPWNPSR
jgi:hypothetical protein